MRFKILIFFSLGDSSRDYTNQVRLRGLIVKYSFYLLVCGGGLGLRRSGLNRRIICII